MAKWGIGLLLALLVFGRWQFSAVPDHPTHIVEAEVLSLRDVPDRPGRRIIAVRFEDGRELEIETLTPFFYRPGYTAKVGVFERTLFPDVYDFVSDSKR